MARLKRRNILSQVYVNGVLWDADDPSWEKGGRQGVVRHENGTERKTVFNSHMKHALGFMCGSAHVFQRRIVALARKLRRLGLDGLYLDCIACATGLPCYHAGHDHGPGGGTYQAQGFRSLLRKIRRQCPGMVLTSEDCGEIYMDLLDAGIMLSPSWERLGSSPVMDPIPLFSAVYHGRYALFGNYALPDGIPPYDPLWPPEGRWRDDRDWREACPDQFFVEVARGVVWGYQPTVANFRDSHAASPAFAAERAFLREAAQGYYANRSFLFDGRMLPGGKLAVETREVAFLVRTIFTKKEQCRVSRRKMPAVLHSCWEAPDRRRLAVFANYTRDRVSFRYRREGFDFRARLDGRRFLFVRC